MDSQNSQFVNQRGYILLLGIIILGAVSAASIVTQLLLGVQAGQTSRTYQLSKQARALADACTEEALQEIRDTTSYSGSDTLSLGAGSCEYTVTKQGGENRRIEAIGTVDNVVRKVSVSVDTINPEVNVTSWQEVADF